MKRINWFCTVLKFTLLLPIILMLSILILLGCVVMVIFSFIFYIFNGNRDEFIEFRMAVDLLGGLWKPTYKIRRN